MDNKLRAVVYIDSIKDRHDDLKRLALLFDEIYIVSRTLFAAKEGFIKDDSYEGTVEIGLFDDTDEYVIVTFLT